MEALFHRFPYFLKFSMPLEAKDTNIRVFLFIAKIFLPALPAPVGHFHFFFFSLPYKRNIKNQLK